MSKLWVVVFATLPFQIFIISTIGWLTVHAIQERRKARAAAAEALASVRSSRLHAHEPETATTSRRENHNQCITHHAMPNAPPHYQTRTK
jgi:hypothetical protein